MKAAIITIGDELLNGQTIDTNSAWIAQRLNEIGVSLKTKYSVADEHDEIISAIHQVDDEVDIILTTGGLGPTKDDITKKAIADYLNVGMDFSQETYDRIVDLFGTRGIPIRQAHHDQCYMPSGSTLLTNARGTAPGMWMSNDKVIILSMPGVPYEMKSIMTEGGLAKIKSLVKDSYIKHYIIQTAGIGETSLAAMIEDIVEDFPPEVSIAYLPSLANVKLRVTAQGSGETRIIELYEHFGRLVHERVAQYTFGTGATTLPEALGQLCKDRKVTIATAESCTGGGIAHQIIAIPGSSSYFLGTIVSYANSVKNQVLQVKKETLKNHGAVSEETVREMISGLLRCVPADVGVAVSGIAGPGGGTAEKPVGTIWIAVGSKEKVETHKLQLVKDRQINISYTINFAMNKMRLFIEENF